MYNPKASAVNLLLNPGTPRQYTVTVPTAPPAQQPKSRYGEYTLMLPNPIHTGSYQVAGNGELYRYRDPSAPPLIPVPVTRNGAIKLLAPRTPQADIRAQQAQQQMVKFSRVHHTGHGAKHSHNHAAIHQAEDVWFTRPKEQPDQWTLRISDAQGDGYHKWEYKHVHKGEMEGCGCKQCEKIRRKRGVGRGGRKLVA
ncbi:Protein of unknown function [Pyronema omphalodes CBS 100304]|uniref:Uncharacterized protein n=1 Tax=Pyronema omphalodes (strain CBS 100304) TaxID=1076935 RepID=U4LU74_PYROM|nr:Protein of unknown function [Pyronema omphalodes CBS 100304]